MIPHKLYKYQPFSDRTLTALKSRTVWFGRPSRLNDPLDCAVPYRVAPVTLADCGRLLSAKRGSPWDELKGNSAYVDSKGIPTEQLRADVERAGRASLEDTVSKEYGSKGVTCFSDSPDNTLLWSHYGGGHRGMCLEFDTTSPILGKFHPITYTDRIPEINIVDLLVSDHASVLWGLLTKAKCWSYEREWRAIHKDQDVTFCYGVEALTGVYLGAALSDAEADLVCHILHGSKVQLYRVATGRSSFALEIRKVEYTPYAYG